MTQSKQKTLRVTNVSCCIVTRTLEFNITRKGSNEYQKRISVDQLDQWIQKKHHSGGVTLFDDPDVMIWVMTAPPSIVESEIEDMLSEEPEYTEADALYALTGDEHARYEVLEHPKGQNVYGHHIVNQSF